MQKNNICFITALIFLLPLNALAAMYKWTDSDGNVIYSQRPPPDNQPRQQIKPPPPPAESADEVMGRLNNRLQKLEDLKEDQELGQEKAAKGSKNAAQSASNCKAAKHNLDVYKNRPANVRYRDTNGKVSRFTTEQRQEKIKTATEQIKKDCK